MSKVIKSHHCIEAHPCRLEPVDVDAFFVSVQEDEPIVPSDPETAAALEEILETISISEGNSNEEGDQSLEPVPEGIELTNDFAVSKIDNQEIDLFKLNLEAERIIDQSNQEASTLIWLAQENAESITGAAKEEATGIMEKAKAEAAKLNEQAERYAEKIIETARQQADETLVKAKQEAEETIAQARRQAEELKKEAREEGIKIGRQEGLAKAKQEMEQNLANSLKLQAQAEEERIRRIMSSETEILKLASGIAEKIIGSELQSHPEQFLSIIREALGRVATANTITIRINPEDLDLIREKLPVLQEVFNDPKTIELKGDQNIPKHDCFIETEYGKVDARIKTQLERIMSEVLKAGRINECD